MDFTKHKFLSFSEPQKHKKCAEMLRTIYELMLKRQPYGKELESYNQALCWLNLPQHDSIDAKTVADLYHQHLAETGRGLKEHNLLPDIRKGDRAEGAKPWPIAIYLDHIRSAHNVGSIIRTAEAMSLGTLCFSKETPFTDVKQVKDAAMGADEWVSCRKNAILEELPRPIILLETSKDAVSLHEFIFPEVFTLVLGNEEYGCSEHALKLADYIVEIPLRGRKNSLNVANAFAIAAAEILRQRGLE